MTPSTASSAAFIPVILLLARSGSPLALVYAASLAATLAYHLSSERRWRKIDHALAWGVIASNAWLAVNAVSMAWTMAAIALVVVSLLFYRSAKAGSYHLWHSLWHVASGAACFCFAKGFVG